MTGLMKMQADPQIWSEGCSERMSSLKAEIVSVGTELLLGQIVNTNAQFLSQGLAELGIDVY